MRSYLLSFIFTLLAGLFSHADAFASFDFQPIIATLAPSGSDSNFSFTVGNDEATKLPIQISIVHRKPDLDGKEEYKETPDIDDLFQIYPSQLVLNPKERRTVRVTWIGDPKPKAELAFRIIAEELPFSVDDPNKNYKKPMADIRMASRYVGSLYVTPAGAKADLMATPSKSADGKQLILTVENKGTRHQVLKNIKIKMISEGTKKSIELPTDQLKLLHNKNILAGKTLRLTFPWPRDYPAGAVKVKIDLPQE